MLKQVTVNYIYNAAWNNRTQIFLKLLLKALENFSQIHTELTKQIFDSYLVSIMQTTSVVCITNYFHLPLVSRQ